MAAHLPKEAAAHDLVVVGLGPKAAAVCAKAAAVRELGLGAPRVLVVEQHDPAAHWGGAHGFTTGTEHLGTRPEKDVGFPYASAAAFGPRAAELDRLMTRYSWQAFLTATGRLGDWVDRGCPAPEHRLFGSYLAWVVRSCGDAVEVVRARVTALDVVDGEWLVHTTGPASAGHATGRASTGAVRSRAVLVTGPGVPRRLGPTSFTHPRLVDAGVHRPELARLLGERPCARVAVIGGGESAASLALYVHGLVPDARLELFAPGGLRVRDESDDVNRRYTAGSGTDWAALTEGDRRTFISRTDRGVVSPALSQRLAEAVGGRVHRAAIRSVSAVDGGAGTDGALELHGDAGSLGRFDLVLNATGFDPWQQIDGLLTPGARALLTGGADDSFDLAAAQRRIGPNLRFDGPAPALYAPALAGVTQGPGFANLSCLGHLSDLVVGNVLASRAAEPPAAAVPGGRSPARHHHVVAPARAPRKEVAHAQA
ncbi:SidA/IucD/PvdA family monooxygenase [Streptomyces sp. NPDC020807]|uniref:SidA/IucD/PvdA family monooxygenase n=1 Tax=Streptomyces sp. NPDC020807 TaxID=3155119 RepID=UPI0034002368